MMSQEHGWVEHRMAGIEELVVDPRGGGNLEGIVDNLTHVSGEVKILAQQARVLGENLEQVKASNFSLGTATLEARTEDRQKVPILEGEIHKLWEAQKNADGVNSS
jgi:hypothetical protein